MPSSMALTTRAAAETCNVKATILGYYPNAGLNYFLAVSFALCTISTVFFGTWKRTWGFSIAVGLGCLLECAGYVSRVLLSTNPCNSDAFKLQIVTIIIAPTIICIGLYLTLKHVAMANNPSLSRIPPKWFPYVFVAADVSCLVIQAAGGIVSISTSPTSIEPHDVETLRTGNRLIIAGICLQAIILACFGFVVSDYLLRLRRWIRRGDSVGPAASALWHDRKFKTFVYAIAAAYSAIMIRCIYRIAEMAGGWGNHIMQDEPSFAVLESFMMLIACALFSAFPPGIFFPGMSHHGRKKQGDRRFLELEHFDDRAAPNGDRHKS